jgi:SAM-dependent methyltransferase
VETSRDLWLERWLPLLDAEAAPKPALELGCDTGLDTRWLLARGFPVVATDIAWEALQAARQSATGALFLQHDLRTQLPFATASFNVVVASLCLHYFDADTTTRAVAQVRRVLTPGGLLFCRVNSANDFLHGAGVGEEIEPGYFRQSARYAHCKRFFSAADVERFFPPSDWQIVSREEREVLRYAMPKVAWELVLRSSR